MSVLDLRGAFQHDWSRAEERAWFVVMYCRAMLEKRGANELSLAGVDVVTGRIAALLDRVGEPPLVFVRGWLIEQAGYWRSALGEPPLRDHAVERIAA